MLDALHYPGRATWFAVIHHVPVKPGYMPCLLRGGKASPEQGSSIDVGAPAFI